MSFTPEEISTLENFFGPHAFNYEDAYSLYETYRVGLFSTLDITKQLKLRKFVENLFYKQREYINEDIILKHRDLIIRFLKTYVDTFTSYIVPPHIFVNKILLSIWCDILKANEKLTHLQIECEAVPNFEEQQQFLQTLTTMPQLKALTIVGFDFNQGRMQSLVEILASLKALTSLAIEDSKLDIEAGVTLNGMINTLGIVELTLRRLMHDKSLSLGSIIRPLESQVLKVLRLDNNQMTKTDLDLLSVILPRLPQLTALNLENTQCGDDGVNMLTKLIAANQLPLLVAVCLINNGITDAGAGPLLLALHTTPTSSLDSIMLGSADHFYPSNTPRQAYETDTDWDLRLENRYGRGRAEQLSYFVSTDRGIPNEVSVWLRGLFKECLAPKAAARLARMVAQSTASSEESVPSASASSSATATHFGSKATPFFPTVTGPIPPKSASEAKVSLGV